MKLKMYPCSSSQNTRNRNLIRRKLRYAILLFALTICILPPGLYSQDLNWTSIQPLVKPRRDHGAATGPDGLIYVVGGKDNIAPCLNTMEQHDPKIPGSHWFEIPTDMPTPRSFPGVVCGVDGFIYVIGGASCAAATSAVERYDTSMGTWEPVASLNLARIHPAVAVGPDLRIYAFGGFNGSNTVNTVEAYDAALDKWTPVISVIKNFRHAATGLDGNIYLFEDGIEATWATFDGSLFSKGDVTPPPDNDFSAVTGPDGLVYLLGVGLGGSHISPPTQVVAYDANGELPLMIPSLIQSRSGGAATAAEGQIFITGGFREDTTGLLSFAEAYGPLNAPLFPNAVAWWRFEEPNNAPVIDSTKHGVSGMLIGSPVHVMGRVANAMQFNGLTQGIKFNDSSKINFGKDSFTIEGWVKWSPTSNTVSTIIDKRTRTGGNSFRGYHLFVSTGGKLGLQLANGTTFANYLTTNTSIQPDQWTHIAVTVDRNSSKKIIRFYINSVLDEMTYTPLAGDISNTAPLTVAFHGFSKLPFKGAIDELTMYNRALRWAEIRAVFLAGKEGKK